MLSSEKRSILRKNQLAEVICQLRFPEILMIGQQTPAAFQELIRKDYPQYSTRKDIPAPKITGMPGNLSLENPEPGVNYQFISTDNVWRVNLTTNFISLACSRYTCWEDFAKRLDKVLSAFIQTYHPAYFQRIGLRYLNFISRKSLSLEQIPYCDLIQSCYLGPMGEVTETSFSRCSIDAELALRGGCRVKIHAGPGLTKVRGVSDKEVRFVFDQDLFMTGNVPVNYSAGALETLHSQAYPVFRGAITDTLFSAMEPESI